VVILKVVVAGAIAGVLSNVTGYLITGRLFHPYQGRTPNTWRITESWVHYLHAAAARIVACIAIGFLYAALGRAAPTFAEDPIARGVSFGVIVWAVTILPLIHEVTQFVNWHRGFAVGLLLDWLVVYVLASVSAAVVLGAV
jgi:hypothetical protein